MTFCINCGSEIVENAKFCQKCGHPTEKANHNEEKRKQEFVGKIYKCPNCGEEHHIYGESNIETLASKYQVKHIAKLPIDPTIATAVDGGAIEACKGEWLDELAKAIMD